MKVMHVKVIAVRRTLRKYGNYSKLVLNSLDEVHCRSFIISKRSDRFQLSKFLNGLEQFHH